MAAIWPTPRSRSFCSTLFCCLIVDTLTGNVKPAPAPGERLRLLGERLTEAGSLDSEALADVS